MATPASAVTQWDAQGNPIPASSVTEWDAQGNPIHSASVPALDLSNPQGQGIYKMADSTGRVVGVPYGKVSQAASAGYSFADDEDRWRYAKDNAADPNRSGGSTYGSSYTPVQSEQTPEGHRQAVYAREDAAGPVGQLLIGAGKAGGVVTKPIADLASVVGEATGAPQSDDNTDYTEARNGLQAVGKYGTLAGMLVPAAIEAPVAAVGSLAAGTVSSMIGKTVGEHLGLTDKQSDLLSDLFAIAGGIGGGYGGAKLQPKVSGLLGGVEGADAEPGLVKQITKGKAVEQPGAQNAVRTAVQASADDAGTANDAMAETIKSQPIAKGGSTILDDHLNALAKMEKAAYKQVDDTVGFDLKAEKAQLANDQYKLSQLGNTDADITQRGNLIEAINDSTDRITEAQNKLKAAGIDPDAADAIHKQRMAGVDFKKVLVRSTQPDGSVNVDRLLAQSNNLRYSRYGDRLQQFFGSKEAADSYIDQLTKAQRLGVHALKAQRLAWDIAKWVGGGIGVGFGAKVLHQTTTP